MSRTRKSPWMMPFGPEPTSAKYETKRDTVEKIKAPLLSRLRPLGLSALFLAIGFFICVMLTLCFGCATAKEQPLPVTDQWIQYDPAKIDKGFVGRTANGFFLVTPGYVKWAEGLSIDLDAANAKLEQERISKLAPAK